MKCADWWNNKRGEDLRKQDVERDDPLILIWFDLIKENYGGYQIMNVAQIPNGQQKILQSHKFFISSLNDKSLYVLFFNFKWIYSRFSLDFFNKRVWLNDNTF